MDRCDLKSDDQSELLNQNQHHSIIYGTLKLREGSGWRDEAGGVNTMKFVHDVDNALGCESHCRSYYGCVGWTYILVSLQGIK